MLIVCPSCGIKYNVPASYLKKDRVLKCASCGTSWIVPAITAKSVETATSGSLAESPAPAATAEDSKAPPATPALVSDTKTTDGQEEPAHHPAESEPVPEPQDVRSDIPEEREPPPSLHTNDQATSGHQSEEVQEPVVSPPETIATSASAIGHDDGEAEEAIPEADKQPLSENPVEAAVSDGTPAHHEEGPHTPPSFAAQTESDAETETEEHTHFSFLDEALARDASENRASQSPQMSVWDEAELEDQIAHSSWQQQHADEQERLADEPANLDNMEPEDLHALMQRNQRHTGQELHADHSGFPSSAGNRAGTEGAGSSDEHPAQDSLDDVVARLRAARMGEATGTEAGPKTASPQAETPVRETQPDEPAAPWVPAWERAQQTAPVSAPEPEQADEETEDLPVWATVGGTDAAEAHGETPVQHEAAPAETADDAEIRHVESTVDIASRLRNDVLQRGSMAPQIVRRPSLLEQPAFWKKAWIASGVCAIAGTAAFWHWFGALRQIWPALNLL